MASIEVLCAADIHIGRRPGRLADKYDPADFSPRTTWANLAKSAIDRQVDAVVVAGDLVDRENRYAEAFGAVESVASTLSGADIPFFCVAGNHDHNVLPDLAEAIDDVQLLGRDGTWERAILAGTDGEPQVHVDGWSFPSRYHHESPLATYDLIDEGVPRLGVVHADMSDEDRYAPVVVDDLAASGHAAWVLGHLHNPGLRHETPLFFIQGHSNLWIRAKLVAMVRGYSRSVPTARLTQSHLSQRHCSTRRSSSRQPLNMDSTTSSTPHTSGCVIRSWNVASEPNF